MIRTQNSVNPSWTRSASASSPPKASQGLKSHCRWVSSLNLPDYICISFCISFCICIYICTCNCICICMASQGLKSHCRWVSLSSLNLPVYICISFCFVFVVVFVFVFVYVFVRPLSVSSLIAGECLYHPSICLIIFVFVWPLSSQKAQILNILCWKPCMQGLWNSDLEWAWFFN